MVRWRAEGWGKEEVPAEEWVEIGGWADVKAHRRKSGAVGDCCLEPVETCERHIDRLSTE